MAQRGGALTLADVLRTLEQAFVSNSRSMAVAHDAGQHVPLPASADQHVERYSLGDKEPLTLFHSRVPPTFPLVKLAEALRIPSWSNSEESALQAAVLMLRYSEFTGIAITTAMMHRLYAAATLLVSKTHHDAFPRNDSFGQAAGMALWEVNRLEVALLDGCGWRMLVTADDVEHLLVKARAGPQHSPFLMDAIRSQHDPSATGGHSGAALEAAASDARAVRGDQDGAGSNTQGRSLTVTSAASGAFDSPASYVHSPLPAASCPGGHVGTGPAPAAGSASSPQ